LENDRPGETIRILVTAPFPAVRAGLRALVETDPLLQVIAECASPVEWGSHIPRTQLILLAPVGPLSHDWMDLVVEKAPGIPTLFLLSQPLANTPDLDERMWGALPFTASARQIVLAVRALMDGFMLAQPGLLPESFRKSMQPAPPLAENLVEPLTRREIDVLQCLAMGYSNKETARQLKISPQTVKFHISSIYTKLGASSRTEAVRFGVRLGYVNL
jgi:DNA-binding NarL/FixJ family response regulator